MAIAKAKGKLKGRAPKPSAPRQAHLRKLHSAGEHTIAELAELFEVSRPTVYRVLERSQTPRPRDGHRRHQDGASSRRSDRACRHHRRARTACPDRAGYRRRRRLPTSP
ncbi:helix-turn-helix domain-containing protein [Krasilnikovia cinnamomea]|uniref:helix-turn-helix domain-containing protein n=1 Tax=Krasilnikovia cinnamomea TaxID=349313 RepID=UPI001F5F35CF|nr:helix-turn-helix domain-containing protein [Krasilnikovia cinnamomea]